MGLEAGASGIDMQGYTFDSHLTLLLTKNSQMPTIHL